MHSHPFAIEQYRLSTTRPLPSFVSKISGFGHGESQLDHSRHSLTLNWATNRMLQSSGEIDVWMLAMR